VIHSSPLPPPVIPLPPLPRCAAPLRTRPLLPRHGVGDTAVLSAGHLLCRHGQQRVHHLPRGFLLCHQLCVPRPLPAWTVCPGRRHRVHHGTFVLGEGGPQHDAGALRRTTAPSPPRPANAPASRAVPSRQRLPVSDRGHGDVMHSRHLLHWRRHRVHSREFSVASLPYPVHHAHPSAPSAPSACGNGAVHGGFLLPQRDAARRAALP